MDTLTALGGIQIARAAAFPAKFADNPVRALSLDGLQRRNAVLDAVFYDVAAIRREETHDLAFWLAREGAILVVPPTGGDALKLYPDIADYFASGHAVAALAVAGVGSSALGAAAFARNVADALGEPVAAVVSGYGLADILTEALGGFFWFGGLNSLRHVFEPLDTVTKALSLTEGPSAQGPILARTSQDTRTVVALLKDPRFSATLLVGHSKGNLVISEALYAIKAEDPALASALAARCRIVTFGAKIGMPVPFRDVIDVMGAWDWFGALNSRPDIPADHTVPGAWHSTNPAFPMKMGIDVTATLKLVLAQAESLRSVSAATKAATVFDLPQRMAAALLKPAA